MTLSETDRNRAFGFLRAFHAEIKPVEGELQIEVTNDTCPELKILKPVPGKPLTPTDIVASCSVLRVLDGDYEIMACGLMTACHTLSDAVERARSILQGEIKV
jgi:hypothetical protein